MKASIVTTKQCKRHCGLRFAAAVAASATVKIAQITHIEVQTKRLGLGFSINNIVRVFSHQE